MPDEDVYSVKLNFREHLGQLYIKAFIKMFAGLFIALQFFLMPMPFVSFIALAVLFVMYFTMPTSYYEDEPYKTAEAWIKTLYGIFISLMLLTILTPGGWPAVMGSAFSMLMLVGLAAILVVVNINVKSKWYSIVIALGVIIIFSMFVGGLTAAVNPALSIFYLSIAFFCVPPQPKGKRPGSAPTIIVNNLINSGKNIATGKFLGEKYGDDTLTKFSTALFIAFAGVGGYPIITWLTAAPLGGAGIPAGTIIVGAIWAMSFMAGLVSNREARPYLGIMIIGVAILAFSFQYTGTIGTAVFGGFWPQVSSGITAITAPMGPAWDQLSQSISDTKMMMTCPSCYYAEMERRQQQASSKVTEGGTVKAIEQTEFRAINYAEDNPSIDPTIPLIGSVKLENQGTFTATNLAVTFGTLELIDPTQMSAADPNKGHKKISSDDCKFSSCTGSDEADTTFPSKTCNWKVLRKTMPPSDIKLLMFKCGQPSEYNSWSGDIQKCDCFDVEKNEYVYEDGSCTGCSGLVTYSNADWMISLPLTYTYSYKSNVSMDNVEVMDRAVFDRKLLNNELTLFNAESKFSGGPVKIALFVQDQPLRSGEPSFGRISLINTGKGNVTGGTLTLWLPSNLAGVKLKNDEIKNVGSPGGLQEYERSTKTVDNVEYSYVTFKLTSTIEPTKSFSYTFSFTYDLSTGVESKSMGFRGNVDYDYKTISEIQLPLIKAPLQQ